MSATAATPARIEPLDPRAVPPPPMQRFCTLPNGLEIACQSAKETEHIYEDIFEHRVYLGHGLTLWDGARVFDVGGNIGMFTMFVHQHFRDAVTYTFEPAPPLFDILHHNAARHALHQGGTCKLFNCGLSDRTTTASFTFYPYSSGMSSFYGDETEEREVLETILANQRESGHGEGEVATVLERPDEFFAARLTSIPFECRLVPLSAIVRQEGVETIDLLKIDVQKSELDVLRGIAPEDWPRVRQIAIEVHDLDGQLAVVQELLEEHGFRVVTEQDPLYRGSVMYNLFAVRRDFYQGMTAASPGAAVTPGTEPETKGAARSQLAKAAFARLRGQRR